MQFRRFSDIPYSEFIAERIHSKAGVLNTPFGFSFIGDHYGSDPKKGSEGSARL